MLPLANKMNSHKFDTLLTRTVANLAEFRARVLRCEIDNGETLWTLNFFVIRQVDNSYFVMMNIAIIIINNY